ncbi:hypothetical protein CDAR_309271 [Caerostris darwini]|uniref:Uncharacterized protein n=1 Tax=Caerostris darwini TaxID=1538125 RepID=A0AAV4QM26_9ARAC|nr:hypothetical protein CDAR_309271 [Caerostris darwini]
MNVRKCKFKTRTQARERAFLSSLAEELSRSFTVRESELSNDIHTVVNKILDLIPDLSPPFEASHIYDRPVLNDTIIQIVENDS